ncbi:MAG: hypothetical protein J5716_03070, partial [Alphaproteobacteria bacterium]|nr:hypothetical protein [Alphaproteobacteria bacterium]
DKGTKIGKFGIGFKAVYGYTDEPEIYSKDYNFKITDFFVPEKIPAKSNFDASQTLFILPFNYESKSKADAYNEIKKGLNEISPNTLLFLNKIKTLKWCIEGIEHCLSKRQSENTFLLYSDERIISKYLRFDGEATYYDQEKKTNVTLPISLAYKLHLEIDKMIISEMDANNVYTYFKVKNENAKIRYLINALFELTQARDKLVSDSEINKEILSQIADLQVSKMAYLRDNGYLNTDFLGVLPNSQDCLTDMYKFFHTSLIDVFQNQDFTPTRRGKYRASKFLYRSDSADVCEIITDNDLSLITNHNVPLWCANVLKNTNADKFLDDLDINKWGRDELLDFLSDKNKRDVCAKIFKEKEYKHLRTLYKTINENYYYFHTKNAPIFRTQNGLKCVDDSVYFPAENKFGLPDDINILTDDLFKGISKDAKERLYDYLKKIGIKEFDTSERFQHFMHKFKEERTFKDTKRYILELGYILKYKETNNIDLSNIEFILDRDNILRRPMDVYIDDPFERTDLQYLESISGKHPLSQILYKELSSSERSLLIDLIKEKGGLYKLKIEHLNTISKNPHQKEMKSHVLRGDTRRRWGNEHEYDYDIEYLDQIISNESILKKTSHLIWKCLLSAEDKELRARYTANQRDIWHTAPSLFVCLLQDHAWILGKDGILHQPQDINIDDLPDDWERPDPSSPQLAAIKFNERNTLKNIDKRVKDCRAMMFGFANAQEADQAVQLMKRLKKSGKSFDDLNAFLSQSEKELPVSSSRNPERRAAKVIEEHENSAEKEYSVVSRTIRISSSKVGSEAHEFLSNEYANDDNEMFCQMCQTEMPFKKRDNSPYFEAIEIFTELSREDKIQYIALCPNCAAEFDEWVRKNKNDDISKRIKNAILNTSYQGEDAVEIPFTIHSEQKTLRFTGKHFLDLQTILKQENQNTDISEDEQSVIDDDEWIPAENIVLHNGDIVRHSKYGIGEVIENNGSNVRVNFKIGDTKLISCDFLEKKTG